MHTQIMIENLTLQLVVLNQMKELLEQLDDVDCWCNYHAWNTARKVSFIKEACKLLGISDQELRFSDLIDDVKRTPLGNYPECLTWEKFFQACCEIKKSQLA